MKFFLRKFFKKGILTNFLYEFAFGYPTPSNLSYFWNFGFLALVCLVFQIITGIILAMHYVPHADLAFASVEHIMRDVNYGYLLRYMHLNGASMFFFVVYIHLLRGFYFGSYVYPRQILWASGVIILLVMIITAFMGYVLPWGQMSFWAATVITNLFSAVPIVGTDLVYWLWGGFAVDNPTLNRFFSLHYLLPFVIVGLVIFHLVCLHNWGSNNPLGISTKVDNFSFTPYFFIKDFSYLNFFILFAAWFIFFVPNYLGHPDNYIAANPLVTPNHIVPEWYFLPFYAILRALPDKLLGAVALVCSILVLLFLPFYANIKFRSSYFKPIFQIFFWIFLVVVLTLGWVGGKPVEPPYYFVGQVATFGYFFYLLIIVPVLSKFDHFLAEQSIITFLKK
jgi:quinol-cytochrome oxidoreductase complex cytochrome b subunit